VVKARAWWLLAVLSLVGFQINASTFNALGVVLPDMVRDLKWSWTEAGLGFTILGAACGSSALLPALLIRRHGVRTTLLAGTAVMAAGFLCLARAHGVTLYFLGTALCGVGYQMMALIPGTHVLAALFQRRGVPFGIYFTFGALGGVAGPWMVWAVNAVVPDGWRVFWLVQMGLAVALGLICAAMVGGREWLTAVAARTDQAVAAEGRDRRAGGVHRTLRDWTVAEAVRTPQFLILLAAYFAHLLVGATVSSLSVAHLTQRGITMSVALGMLSLEALVQTAGRAGATAVGDRLDPRHLLLFALLALAVGSAALSVASSYPLMLLYAVGSGLGFGLTGLAVTMLLLNYYGRGSNLEIFARTCLIGAFSALGPTLGGELRDLTGGFGSTFELYAAVIAVVFVAVVVMRPPRHAEERVALAEPLELRSAGAPPPSSLRSASSPATQGRRRRPDPPPLRSGGSGGL
jgi:MFS family permease